jgi:hypothetical protein
MVTLTGHPVQPARVPRNRGRRIRQGKNHRPSLLHHPPRARPPASLPTACRSARRAKLNTLNAAMWALVSGGDSWSG